MANAPWASGPGEILQHAIQLLSEDSDSNRRLALILIDNAVELTVKTYLSLPRRVTGVKLGRKDFDEIAESFPALLDALEQHAADKIAGIDLGEIEWYHRVRNELYHQGNGLTVERRKVEVYAELAKVLFKALFGVDLPAAKAKRTERVGQFLTYWTELEKQFLRGGHEPRPALLDWWSEDPKRKKELWQLRNFRNRLVHGEGTTEEELRRAIEKLIALLQKDEGK